MQAAVYHKPKDIRVEEWKEPEIQHSQDAVLRVTSTAICGSDLHIFNGLVPQLGKMVLGHEFMGIVEEVGPSVQGLKEGDRVVVPFPIADGTCWFCRRGLPTHCENSNRLYGPEGGLVKGKGAALFGYTDLYGGIDGGQAERVRVPYADNGPRKVPAGLTDEEALLLTDVIPTAWCGVDWGEVGPGDTVAVFGCGPVGLMAQRLAKFRGAEEVVAVDIEPYRLEAATRLTGSVPIDASQEEPADAIRAMTDGRGADVCIDAVGLEAHRNLLDTAKQIIHLERGTIKALRACFDSVRRGGRVAVLGVYPMSYDNFPIGQFFDKGLMMRGGQATVHSVIDDLLEHVVAGRIRGDDIISHTLPLEEAAHGYDIFTNKQDDCIKVVLKP